MEIKDYEYLKAVSEKKLKQLEQAMEIETLIKEHSDKRISELKA